MRLFPVIIFCLITAVIFAQPNILWIVCEDISPTLSMYGDSTAKTPNLDALAAESTIYDNAFAPVAVCAPARSAIITGMYPTTLGTMHMRTGKDIHSWGKRIYKPSSDIKDLAGNSIRQYSVVTPVGVKCFTEYLRTAGYYCTNNQKTDYQFAAPLTAWDENNNQAHWRLRAPGQPFFAIFNFGETHESRLWKNNDLPLTVDPPLVKVPPYLQDTETMRRDIARHYSNVELLDKKVGALIQDLKDDGFYDETIIFFYSDHGGPLPRQKRAIYDSGSKVPFFIKYKHSEKVGRDTNFISFVDLAPTMLSLANIQIPEYIEGIPFAGEWQGKHREYVLGSGDRFDEYTDRVRSLRTHQYLYIQNKIPNQTGYKDISYRKNIPGMREMLVLKNEDRLTDVQKQWFAIKATEELYDVKNDPHQVNNLAGQSEFEDLLIALRKQFQSIQNDNKDLGLLPEAELIELQWPGGKQPMATAPTMIVEQDFIMLTTETQGASMAYRFVDKSNTKLERNDNWKLYTKPIPVVKGKILQCVAERIGFQTSSLVEFKIE